MALKDDVAKSGQGPVAFRSQRCGSALRSVLFAGVVVAGGPAFGREAPAQDSPPAVLLSPSGEPFRLSPQTPDPLGAWFAGADSDHDGRITLAEFAADAMRFFAVVDRDSDGRIDRAESDRYERELVPELNSGPPQPPGPPRILGGRAPAGRRPASLTGEQQPIRAADTDINQVVTQAEFRALTDRRFVALNLVRDNALTRDELPEAMALAAPGQRRPSRGRPEGTRLRDPNTRSEAGVGY
jgi:hypothetical protein